ncbi:MAG: zinc-dependent metalloprotease [Nonlabens sp.]
MKNQLAPLLHHFIVIVIFAVSTSAFTTNHLNVNAFNVELSECKYSNTSRGFDTIRFRESVILKDSILNKKFKGLYNFSYNENEGTIELEVKKNDLNKDFLYVHALSTGLGSNDIGLDRGQLGGGVVVKWVKAGNKLFLIQPNLKYRASSTNLAEKESVEQAFARSVLFGFKIKSTKDEVHHIDFTPFLMQDTHGVANRLKSQGEGTYKLDKSRSALWMENTKAFPKNVEFETMLTFTGEPKGRNIRSVSPDAESISMIQHHSFVELPDDKYVPRKFHPRSGSFYTSYYDYSSPIGTPLEQRWITRHRIEKENPQAELSEAVEPIIYYLDPGTPEPVRSGLLEGARWWNQAFESAGYKNAFQVKMLPEDADPMDLRYNMIQWVHRSTRGWSYGASITDPRTGEIIKGHVSLGSLRIRQDYMLAQGMLDKPFANGVESPKMLEMALARIRQLSAHEVGHTLGFAHNFAASAIDRASVMDYPHPNYRLIDGKIDVSDAYDIGIGAWDRLAVQYSYGTPSAGQSVDDYLNSILEKAEDAQLDFISDSDARASSGAHASAHLWDNGSNAASELNRIVKIREVAMNQFSSNNIPDGQPLSVLEDVFVPVYYSHRYQVEATSKLLGGMRYTYAINGNPDFEYVSKKEQKKALYALMETLQADFLTIPKNVLKLFPPRAYGYSRDRESFKSETGVAYDPVAAALTSADFTLALVLNPTRLNRITQQEIYGNNLKVNEIMDTLTDHIFKGDVTDNYEQLILSRLKELYLTKLLTARNSNRINVNVKAEIINQLKKIKSELKETSAKNDAALLFLMQQAETHPETLKEIPVSKIPDGSPIGSCGM